MNRDPGAPGKKPDPIPRATDSWGQAFGRAMASSAPHFRNIALTTSYARTGRAG